MKFVIVIIRDVTEPAKIRIRRMRKRMRICRTIKINTSYYSHCDST